MGRRPDLRSLPMTHWGSGDSIFMSRTMAIVFRARTNPACRPMGSQREKVRIRHQPSSKPIRVNVVKSVTKNSGVAKWPSVPPRISNPAYQARGSAMIIPSGGLRKWATENIIELPIHAVRTEHVRSQKPNNRPRNKSSSMIPTPSAGTKALEKNFVMEKSVSCGTVAPQASRTRASATSEADPISSPLARCAKRLLHGDRRRS